MIKSNLHNLLPETMDTELIKEQAWLREGILVVSIHDEKLTWLDREYLKQVADKIFSTERK